MQNYREITVSSVEYARTELIQHLRSLLDRSLTDSTWADGLLEALAMLATLPLTTHEFGLATNRLHNARRYVTAQERGAACFELRLLLGSLKNSDDARPIRRRLRNAKPEKGLEIAVSVSPPSNHSGRASWDK